MSCSTCSSCNGCGCDQCRPANTVFRATCTDPGTITFGTYLYFLDAQFCPARLVGAEGIVQSRQDGSGNFQITVTESPQIDLPTTQAVVGTPIPNLIGIDSNDFWYEIIGPALANQILLTNAAGQLIFGPIPAATVPDPLTLANITATTLLTGAALTVTGATTLSGAAAGTITGVLGVNGAGLVVTQTVASLAAACAMFFESPTSPGASYPNTAVTAGSNLTIGNLLFDSGSTLINVTTSQTLTVAVAGAYVLQWGGMMSHTVISAWRTGIQLVINGLVVSNGSVNPSEAISSQQVNVVQNCTYSRRLAVGDTIQLKINPAAGANLQTYEVWLNATRVSA